MNQQHSEDAPYKPFDAFAKEFLTQELADVGEVESSAIRVAPEQYIDVQFTRTKAPPPSPSLLHELAGQGSLWEPFSTLPNLHNLRDNIEKHLAYNRDTRAKRKEREWEPPHARLWITAPFSVDPKHPLQDIASLHRHLADLNFSSDAARGPGFYTLGPAWNVGLIVLDELPVHDGTLCLRLLGRDPTLKHAVARLKERIQLGHDEDRQTLRLLLRWGIYHKTLGLNDPWLQEIMMHLTTEQAFQIARRKLIRETPLEELLEINPDLAHDLKPQMMAELKPQMMADAHAQLLATVLEGAQGRPCTEAERRAILAYATDADAAQIARWIVEASSPQTLPQALDKLNLTAP